MEQRIQYALKHNPVLRDAQEKEGIDPDKIPDVLLRTEEHRSRL